MNSSLKFLRKRWTQSTRRQRVSLMVSIGLTGFVLGLLIMFLNLSAELNIHYAIQQNGSWELRMDARNAKKDQHLEILYMEDLSQLSDGSMLILRSDFDDETGLYLKEGRWPENAGEIVPTSAWISSHGHEADGFKITGITESSLPQDKEAEVVYGLGTGTSEGLAYCVLKQGADPADYERLASRYGCYLNPQLWNAEYQMSPIEKFGWLFFVFAIFCALSLVIILNRLFLTQRQSVLSQLAGLGISRKMRSDILCRMMLPSELWAWSLGIACMTGSSFALVYRRTSCIWQLFLLWLFGSLILICIVLFLIHHNWKRHLRYFRYLRPDLPLSFKEALRTGFGWGILTLVLINCLLTGCTCFYADKWMKSREAMLDRQNDVTFQATISGSWAEAMQEKKFVQNESSKFDMKGNVFIELPCVINGMQGTIQEREPSVLSGPFSDTKVQVDLLTLWNETAGSTELEAENVEQSGMVQLSLSAERIHELIRTFPSAEIRLTGAYSGQKATEFASALEDHVWQSQTPVYIFDHQTENRREDHMRLIVGSLVYGLDALVLAVTLAMLRAVLLQNLYDSAENLKKLRSLGISAKMITSQRTKLIVCICVVSGFAAGLMLFRQSPLLMPVCIAYGLLAGFLLAVMQKHLLSGNSALWNDPVGRNG